MSDDLRGRRERRLEAARGYLMLEMPGHALGELEAIRDPGEAVFDLHQLRGEALRCQGQFAGALSSYDQALAERPADLTTLMGMAWCYKRTGRLPQAIAAMERAYRACPEEPVILYNLACYFSLAGKKVQALSWLGRALRMEASLRRLVSEEADFDPLRADADFQFIVRTIEEADSLR